MNYSYFYRLADIAKARKKEEKMGLDLPNFRGRGKIGKEVKSMIESLKNGQEEKNVASGRFYC